MRVFVGEVVRFRGDDGDIVTMKVERTSDPLIVSAGLRIITGRTPEGRMVSCYDGEIFPLSTVSS